MIYSTEDGLRWKQMYERDGMSVEAIALEVGASTETIRRQLHRVGTQMRPAGGGRRSNRGTHMKDGVRGQSSSSVRVALTRHVVTGHRRHATGL